VDRGTGCKFYAMVITYYLLIRYKQIHLKCLFLGGVGGFIAIAHLLELGVGERPIDFVNNYYASLLGISVMASFACVNGDTWASELGILSKTDPVLITDLSKKVPKGTNGGVSQWGLFVSFAGGIFIGLFYYVATLIFIDRDLLIDSPPQYPMILLGKLK